jgi:hypothetical protein
MLKEYIQDPANIETRSIQRPYMFPDWPDGVVMDSASFIDGKEGRPNATIAHFPDETGSWAHLHTTSQFQFVLSGSVQFPTYRVDAPAVHYTDHCVAYGPFTVSGNQETLNVRPRAHRQVYSRDPEIRKMVNREGRTLIKSAGEVEWEPFPGHEGARRKVLIPGMTEIVECPPAMGLSAALPIHGQLQVVIAGSVELDGKTLGYKGMRYVVGDEQPTLLRCGSQGATVVFLTFDEDAEWIDEEVPPGPVPGKTH